MYQYQYLDHSSVQSTKWDIASIVYCLRWYDLRYAILGSLNYFRFTISRHTMKKGITHRIGDLDGNMPFIGIRRRLLMKPQLFSFVSMT